MNENWGSSDSVVSIHSRGRAHSGATPTMTSQPPPPAGLMIEEEEEDWKDIDEQLTARQQAATYSQPHPSQYGHQPNSAAAIPATVRKSQLQRAHSVGTTSPMKKNRTSNGGTPDRQTARTRSRLLPPPPSSGYGSPNYHPGQTPQHSQQPTTSSTLMATYGNLNGTAASPSSPQRGNQSTTKYLGMQAPKTEWLLPTRVSVKERTTATTAAKTTFKSPKADKNWKGEIPENQNTPFNLDVYHPKVLDTPLSSLPGSKNPLFESTKPLQRVPVNQAQTRASLEKRIEKHIRSSNKAPSPAQLLEDEIERRRADKRSRFEIETEKAKEQLWRETNDLAMKQVMVMEERAFVDELRQRIRQARVAREEQWKEQEIKLRQKENLELRTPEQRLSKYEHWLREEQEAQLKLKYIREHNGEQPPPGYGSILPVAEREEEKEEYEDNIPGHSFDSEPFSPNLPNMRLNTVDQGRPVENYHGSFGIEFKMLTDADPEATAPLLAPDQQQAPAFHISNSSLSSSGGSANPSYHGSGGHRNASYGSIGNFGDDYIGMLTESDAGAELGGAAEDAAERESERKYSNEKSSSQTTPQQLSQPSTLQPQPSQSSLNQLPITADHTPEPSAAHRRGPSTEHDKYPSTNVGGHHREQSHSARTGVSFAGLDRASGVDDEDSEDPLELDHRPSRTSRATNHGVEVSEGGGANSSREPSRGILRNKEVIEEEATGRGTTPTASSAQAATVPAAAATPTITTPVGANPPITSNSARSSSSSSLAPRTTTVATSGPPIHGTPDSWSKDESHLASGITVIKIPRKIGLFSQPKQVQLFISQGEEGNWLLHWDSKKKTKEDEFSNLSEMKEYTKGLKDNKELQQKKYADKAKYCYSLILPDRTLELVTLSDNDNNILDRFLARITHPSGTHRTPEISRHQRQSLSTR